MNRRFLAHRIVLEERTHAQGRRKVSISPSTTLARILCFHSKKKYINQTRTLDRKTHSGHTTEGTFFNNDQGISYRVWEKKNKKKHNLTWAVWKAYAGFVCVLWHVYLNHSPLQFCIFFKIKFEVRVSLNEFQPSL